MDCNRNTLSGRSLRPRNLERLQLTKITRITSRMSTLRNINGQDVSDIRYIKLGRGGTWADESLAHGFLSFGYHSIPHEVCQSGDWDEVRSLLSDRKSEGSITSGVNEVAAFYEQPADCLWVTFAQGHLWWGFAERKVIGLDGHPDGGPSRIRPMIGGWSKWDARGEPLLASRLSSKLTKVANFRGTICTIEDEPYLLRKIQAVNEPIFIEALALMEQMVAVATRMIKALHWADFETLADLIFARSGWQRLSNVGTGLSDVDILLEQPTTNERAFVQVKSKANQATFDDYLRRFEASGLQRFFFVCHSPTGSLQVPQVGHVHFLSGDSLAHAAIKCGLFEWLVERSN